MEYTEKHNPLVGNTYIADFGEMKFRLHFASESRLLWKELYPNSEGPIFDQKISMRYVRDDIYWVYWQEDDGSTVSHLEDLARETVFSNITTSDQNFLTLEGTFKRLP